MKVTHPFQIRGRNDRFISTSLWKSIEKTRRIAVMFPGFSYSTEAPVFYYLRNLFLEKGMDVLAIDYRYDWNFEFLQLSSADRIMYFNEEQRLIAEQMNGYLDYDEFVFTGKSIGTSALIEIIMSGSIDAMIERSVLIWLTPADRNAEIVEYISSSRNMSLYVACENDRFLDAGLIEILYGCDRAECMVVPEAGHSFDKDGDIEGSIDIMKSIISFVDRNI